MESYFLLIANKLTIDDLTILAILHANDATSTHKSMRKTSTVEQSQLTSAIFRKSLIKLIGNQFVDNVTGAKEHTLYITSYGLLAFNKSMSTEGIE